MDIIPLAHSINSQHRHLRDRPHHLPAHLRSDRLFSEINIVLSRDVDPFLGPWKHAAGVLLPSGGSEAGTVDTGDVSPRGRLFPFRVS